MPFNIDTIEKKGPILIATAALCFLIAASTCLAAGPGEVGSTIRTITPMTEVGSHPSNLNAADYFDLVGRLNKIEGNQATIGDRALTLAPGVSTSGVSQWNLVGANLNNAGEVVVLELVTDNPN